MVNIAQCYMYLERLSLAKQWVLKSIKLDGYNDEAYFLLGECYARKMYGLMQSMPIKKPSN